MNEQRTDWMQYSWRPLMAFLYMLICFNDFALFPILWTILQALTGQHQIVQWQPLTLQNAGLFHFSMGAILGISAYGRSQEKLANVADNFIPTTQPMMSVPDAVRAAGSLQNQYSIMKDQVSMNNVNIPAETQIQPVPTTTAVRRKSASAKPIPPQSPNELT